MKRERIDKTMSLKVINKLIRPFLTDLGARYLVDHPYMGKYDHENKSISWGLGHKKHGDKRHRSAVTYEGIYYKDGKQEEGKTTTVEIDHRLGWSRKLDNRKVANKVTVAEKIMSYEETFNKLRTLTSLDIMTSFSASAQGEIAGIGGTVSQSVDTHAHTEVETEKMNHKKKERVIDDTTVLDYPGPILYDADVLDDKGAILYRKGSVQYEGEIWLIERPVVTLQTTTPMTQWGNWDCARLHINLYDWAGNYGVLPDGKHKNEFILNGFSELLDLIKGNLVLQYPWSAKYRPSKETKEGVKWLEDVTNIQVGPVEWDQIRLNEDVASLEPSIVTP